MAKKDDKKKTTEELNTLFRPVDQKIAKGGDFLYILMTVLMLCVCVVSASVHVVLWREHILLASMKAGSVVCC